MAENASDPPAVAQAPRRAPRRLPFPAPRASNYPSFSPDGRWITFIDDYRHSRRCGSTKVASSTVDRLGRRSRSAARSGSMTAPSSTSGQASTRCRRWAPSGAPSRASCSDSSLAGLGAGNLAALPGGRGVLFTLCTSGCVTQRRQRARPAHRPASPAPGRRGRRPLISRPATCSTSGGTARRWRRRSISAASRSRGRPSRCSRGCGPASASPFLAWSPAGPLIYMQGSNPGEVYEIVRVGRDGSHDPDRHGVARRLQLNRRCHPTGAGWRSASVSQAGRWGSGSSSSTGARSAGSRSAGRTDGRRGRRTGGMSRSSGTR